MKKIVYLVMMAVMCSLAGSTEAFGAIVDLPSNCVDLQFVFSRGSGQALQASDE